MAIDTLPPAPRRPRLTRPLLLVLLPFVITAMALGLRLYGGLDWDQGRLYHPDERSIFLRVDCMYKTVADDPGWRSCINRDFPVDEPGVPSPATFFSAEKSPLNPHWFPLGSILLYVLLIVRVGLEPFMNAVSLQDLATAGRILTALADTASVLLLYALGRRLYGRGVGLLASALSAVAVVSIQLSHFYRPEPFLVLLALASFWYMLNVVQRGRWRDHLALGAVIGLTFATKASSLHLLLPLAVTYGIVARRTWDENRETVPAVAVAGVAVRGVAAAGVSLAVFAFWMPYAFIDLHKFVGDLGWEAGIARNAGQVPYTMQYVGSVLGWYELRQTSVWALGLPLGLAAWGGLLLTIGRSFRRPLVGDLLLLAWVVPLCLTIATFEVKFLRYIAPILPILVLFGSRWLVAAYRWSVPRSAVLTGVAGGTIVFVLLATAFYGLAFVRSHSQPHPGVQASEWANANLAPGTVILTDNHWDEGFANLGRFRVTQLPMYEGDSLAKMRSVTERLARADYIMAYSNRPWGSIARLPDRYPWSSSYYHQLFDGGLGYELDQAFARYPSLLGVTFTHDPFTVAGVAKPQELPGIDDTPLTLDLGYADENVTNYDHPLVLVFRNVQRLPADALFDRIVGETRPGPSEGLLLSEEGLETQRAGGTWTDLFSESSWTNQVPWLVWLLLMEAIALAALPLAATVLRWLPDRGVVLARPLGLLLVAYVTWLGASSGWWHFSRGSVLGSLLLLALVSGALLYHQRRTLLPLARAHWRYIATVEALFLAAFFAFLLIRAANPDLWHPWRGGEKPMDLAYLTAVVKSTTMPPFDPWYAGGYLNYYYFGQFMVATLIKTTGIVPAVAYNLAVPLFYALTFTLSFSVSFNLAEALRRRRYPHLPAASCLGAGAAAALLVVVLGNLDGAAQVLQGAWDWAGGGRFGTFDFWRSSRLMPGQINITEFPFWTFLFADLHAHLMAIPFGLLALGLALNVALSGSGERAWLARATGLALLALSIGVLAAINTWNVPAYAFIGLAAGGVLFLTWPGPIRSSRIWWWLLWSAALVVLAYLLFLPYHSANISSFEGLRRSEWRTPFWQYLGIHGVLFFLVGSWLLVEAYRRVGRPPRWPMPLGSGGIFVALAVALAVVLGLAGWETVGVLAVFLGLAGILVVWWAANRRRAEAPVHLFLLAMVVVALGIGAGVDIFTVKPDIDRMNTVFKLYLDAWALLGVAGGVGLWHLAASGTITLQRPWRGFNWRWGAIAVVLALLIWQPYSPGSAGPIVRLVASAMVPLLAVFLLVRTPQRWLARAWLALLALLVVGSSVFLVSGTRERLRDRFDTETVPLTLDGAAYQQVALYHDPGPSNTGSEPDARYVLADDAAALEYMRQRIPGSPVVLEGVTTQYRWTPRVAIYTGLPTVVGWEFHQTQQRAPYRNQVFQRVRDVDLMYRSPDLQPALALLRKYQVGYIYIGPTERLYYPEDGLRKFDTLLDGNLELFYRNDAVRVYRVLPEPGA